MVGKFVGSGFAEDICEVVILFGDVRQVSVGGIRWSVGSVSKLRRIETE